MPDDYSKGELAKRRRDLNKRVAKLASSLDERRGTAATVASASAARTEADAANYPALKTRRR